jgi:DNA-binding winged helix-turn-helix (wHTH) protein
MPMQRRLVRFGAFEFDPASGDLSKAGRRVKLQNQPRNVLRLLVSRPGELVTREELRRELWPDDTFVDFDNGLNVAIRKIRDAVGDEAPSPRFIETERAHGYRFIAPVSEEPASPEPETGAGVPTMERVGAVEERYERERVEAVPDRRPKREVLFTALAVAWLAGTALVLWRTSGHGPAPVTPRETSAPISLAVAYFHLGLMDDALNEIQTARELNPENRVEPMEVLGAIHLFSGRIDEAVGHLSQVQFSDSRIVKYLLGWTFYYQGERERAEALLETMIDEDGPLPGNARATLAALRATRGARVEARALAERVASEPDLIHHGAYGLATAYAQLHEPETALRWLSQAARTGFPCYPWYERDPLLDPIRDDSRFADFMRDLRRSWKDARAMYSSESSGRRTSQGN